MIHIQNEIKTKSVEITLLDSLSFHYVIWSIILAENKYTILYSYAISNYDFMYSMLM